MDISHHLLQPGFSPCGENHRLRIRSFSMLSFESGSPSWLWDPDTRNFVTLRTRFGQLDMQYQAIDAARGGILAAQG
jgi:hypothetical protein